MTHIQDINAGIEGFVKIVDLDTNRVIREGKNSVHKENMSQTLAEVMSSGNSIVSEIHFGDGATTINTGVITYKPANILGENAGLYHPLYYRLVDSLDFGNVLPSNHDFVPKTKMVRTVHRNHLYSTELEISYKK